MAQGAQPPCKHYFQQPHTINQLGGPPIRGFTPLCKILVNLSRAGAQAQHQLGQVCNAMAYAGGSSMITTQCTFAAQPPCPFYQP
jgi:hypothetical protein